MLVGRHLAKASLVAGVVGLVMMAGVAGASTKLNGLTYQSLWLVSASGTPTSQPFPRYSPPGYSFTDQILASANISGGALAMSWAGWALLNGTGHCVVYGSQYNQTTFDVLLTSALCLVPSGTYQGYYSPVTTVMYLSAPGVSNPSVDLATCTTIRKQAPTQIRLARSHME